MKNIIAAQSVRSLAVVGAVAVGLSGFAVAQPALAKNQPVVVVANPDIVTRRISYADLNLASVSGERTLKHRVSGAISGLCSEATGGQDGYYVTGLARMKCNKTAWGQARPQIANGVQRARDIALTGTSTIAAVAITIDLSK
jgi:UrcA family protein